MTGLQGQGINENQQGGAFKRSTHLVGEVHGGPRSNPSPGARAGRLAVAMARPFLSFVAFLFWATGPVVAVVALPFPRL